MPTNYQEPIEKKDLDTEKKFREAKAGETPAVLAPEKEISPEAEKEAGIGEKPEENISMLLNWMASVLSESNICFGQLRILQNNNAILL